MSAIAFYSSSFSIYWSAIVIVLGIAAWFCLSMALHRGDGGRASAMWLVLALGTVLSVVFCRAIHWYCNAEQYESFLSAFVDFSVGSYCLPGMFLGLLLTGLLAAKLRFADSAAALFDALAPGAALGIALFRLSALFNSSCRGSIAITPEILHRLPFTSEVEVAAGVTEYRFATFFVQFILLLIFTVVLVAFFLRHRNDEKKWGRQRGYVAGLFVTVYSAMEIILDSTRYDSCVLRSNGFVSVVQIVSAVTIVVILAVYCRRSVKANGRHWYHFALWGGYVLSLAAAGGSEYFVQRHRDWFIGCYSVMTLGLILMVAVVGLMYKTLLVKDEDE